MGVAHKPPPSLSVHAQCFWTFTPTERRVMEHALDNYMQLTRNEKPYRTALVLRDALAELSKQD